MHDRFRRLIDALSEGLPERREAVALGVLAMTAGESLFFLGVPGVAKSLVARRFKYLFRQGRSFEYLMGRFSTPEEIFGPLSISGLRDRDVFERKTEGYLPQADVAFLDELWRAGPPIQNTLLTILNEKVFRNGSREEFVPLKLLIGASNRTPDGEENAEAFWDRFLIRLEIHPLSGGEPFQRMLQGKDDLYHPRPAFEDQLDETAWQDLQTRVADVEVPSLVLEALDELRDKISKTAFVSDRRWKKAVRLLRASAVLHNRNQVDPSDLGVLEHVLWQKPHDREPVTKLLLETIEDFGWEGPLDVDEETKTVDAAREALRELTRRSQKVNLPKPVLHDGEYHSILGYPGKLSARVWAQDYALWTSELETEGEIFLFKPMGAYVESRKAMIRKGDGPSEVFVDGLFYKLDAVPEETTVWTKVVPDGKALQKWASGVEHAVSRLEDAARNLELFVSLKTEEASRHLFAKPSHVEACRADLDHAVRRLGDAKVALLELLETRDSDSGTDPF